ncbi:unnamed protein product, partial [Ectocarpus sp. 12 AP-2014]
MVRLSRSGKRTQTAAWPNRPAAFNAKDQWETLYTPTLASYASRAWVTSPNRRGKQPGSPALGKTPIKRCLVSHKARASYLKSVPPLVFHRAKAGVRMLRIGQTLLLMPENISTKLEARLCDPVRVTNLFSTHSPHPQNIHKPRRSQSSTSIASTSMTPLSPMRENSR